MRSEQKNGCAHSQDVCDRRDVHFAIAHLAGV